MIPRYLASRLPSSLSFAFFSTTASSSNPSPAQIAKMNTKEFVESTISGNKVAIFSKSYCPYCRRVKALFTEKFPSIKAEIIELDERDDGPDIQNYLYEKTSQRTVPNVFVDGKQIGGNDDTQEAYQRGELQKLLKDSE